MWHASQKRFPSLRCLCVFILKSIDSRNIVEFADICLRNAIFRVDPLEPKPFFFWTHFSVGFCGSPSGKGTSHAIF